MLWGNTSKRWGAISMVLHWLVALLVLGLMAVGFYMESGLTDDLKTLFTLFQGHKSLGLLVLALAILRLGWRWLNPSPPLPDTLKPWERTAARATHLALYALLLAQPLVGWLMVSASPLEVPTIWFGLVDVPHLIGPDKATEGLMKRLHWIFAWALIALIALHIAAALKHHLILRDDVLRRMLPGGASKAD